MNTPQRQYLTKRIGQIVDEAISEASGYGQFNQKQNDKQNELQRARINAGTALHFASQRHPATFELQEGWEAKVGEQLERSGALHGCPIAMGVVKRIDAPEVVKATENFEAAQKAEQDYARPDVKLIAKLNTLRDDWCDKVMLSDDGENTLADFKKAFAKLVPSD